MVVRPLWLMRFMQRGFVAAVLVGLLCSIVGCTWCCAAWRSWGMPWPCDLPGIAIAYLLEGNLALGALAAADADALGIGFFTARGDQRRYRDWDPVRRGALPGRGADQLDPHLRGPT